GQGVANAVGMAMAARRERGLLDPDAAPGESPFDHRVFVIASDGDLQEGVSAEASSLAGHQRLGSLVLIYDDNKISIEDDTDIAFTEDVLARYAAYGWHTQQVDWRSGEEYHEDVAGLYAALRAAVEETDRPSIIGLRTIIGWPAPNLQDTGKAHGAALGDAEVRAVKEILGFDPDATFAVEDAVLDHTRRAADRGRVAREAWDARYAAWREREPERAALLDRMRERRLPAGWADALPTFPAGQDVATRKASGKVLGALAPVLPELWGGSADLAESNNTTMEGEPSFVPEQFATEMFPGHPYGRTLHFGIREHAMGAILNGITLHGGTRVYGGTFLVFSDYMRPAVRLAALMQLPTIYVWTHDSIGLGEDGPTHQPVEHLAALRAIPGLSVVRPADANETVWAWRTVLERTNGPAGLCLTRQNVPTFERGDGPASSEAYGAADGVARGGYVLAEAAGGAPEVLLVATGSEVQLAVEARERLEAEGVPTRVVSMPCREWFDEQDDAYRESVLPAAVRARVSVEAGVAQGWRDVVGDAGRTVSVEQFGASADYQTLFRELGVTADAVVTAARDSLAEVRGGTSPGGRTTAPAHGGTADR
ncbi:MAG: transketolase family protein, partial [Actinomycetes bacterium]